jgi:hypothetical protein
MFTLAHLIILAAALVVWAVALAMLLAWHHIETRKNRELFARIATLEAGTDDLSRRIVRL